MMMDQFYFNYKNDALIDGYLDFAYHNAHYYAFCKFLL